MSGTSIPLRSRSHARPDPTQRVSGKAGAIHLRSYLSGWKSYFRLADTPGAFRDLDQWIRHRLRALYLKHWKRGPVVFRELRARGMSRSAAAWVAANAQRWWKNSAKAIHIALPNRHFDELGIPRLAA